MDTNEALRRVRLIVPMLHKDVRTAVLSHAVFEASNETIPKGLADFHTELTDTHEAVQDALTLKLALDIARIFDVSIGRFPAAGQDKASLQVLAALMERADVQTALEDSAANGWLPGVEYVGSGLTEDVQNIAKSMEEVHRLEDRAACRQAIHNYLKLMERLAAKDSEEQEALVRVRDFRNRRLAHSLFDKEPEEYPRYSDLNLLLAIAKSGTQYAKLAVEGANVDFEYSARRDRSNAIGYAACVIEGLKRVAKPKKQRTENAD